MRTNKQEGKGKQRYSTPKLVVYGDLRKITQGGGGVTKDGGTGPKTKATGSA